MNVPSVLVEGLKNRKYFLALFLYIVIVVLSTGSATAITDESIGTPRASYVTVSIEPNLPKLMTLGTTYTVSAEIKHGWHTKADFKIILEADGNYFFVNAYEASKQPYFQYYYGSYQYPAVTIEVGETRLVKFFLMPHNLCERSLNITASLYLIDPETGNDQKIASDSFEIRGIISNGLAQRITKILLVIIVTLFPLISFIVLRSKHKRGILLNKDSLIFIALFVVAYFLRSYAIENQSLSPDGSFYLNLAELGMTNNWVLTDKQLLYTAPIFFYLVGIVVYLFGAQFQLLGIVLIVAGSLTVSVIYLLGKELFGRKVGFLSALLLLFSAFHTYYSRVVMIEALSLLSILIFLYLFWKAYFLNAGMKYVILAGVVLGLGGLIKFTAFFAFPTVLMSVLWTRRSAKALFDKKIITVFAICLLVMSPYLWHLHVNKIDPFYFNLVTRPKLIKTGTYGKGSLTFLIRSLEEYNKLLTYGHDILLWPSVFQTGTLILAFISLFFSAFSSFKKQSNFSFITSYWIAASLCISLFFSRFHYYLLYVFVPHYILIAAFIVSFTRGPKLFLKSAKSCILRRGPLRARFKRLSVLFLATLFVSSYFVIGLTVPVIGIGDYEGIKTSVLYIKERINIEGIGTDPPILVAITDWELAIGGYAEWIYAYYFDLYEVKAEVIQLYLFQGVVGSEYRYGIDTNLIKKFQPRFIIVGEYMYSNRNYFTAEVKLQIFSEYRIAMSSRWRCYNTAAQEYYVLERVAPAG